MNVVAESPLDAIRSRAIRLSDEDSDYDALLEAVGDRTFVLLGEATHGTREFYRIRAAITRRLIEEKGFDAVAVEGDWPDCYRVNRYVRSEGDDAGARDALADFERFPRWMWRNTEVLAFIEWLRSHNVHAGAGAGVGFYGLDMYSLYRSSEAVIDYLERVDEDQARIARRQYAALDHVRDPQRYGYEAALGLRPDCSVAVRERLTELIRKSADYQRHDGIVAADAYFVAERNAHVVASAEAYYRAMFGPRTSSWNLRDTHMVQTLLALHRHYRSQGRQGRIVVWAHNSHLGDARATEMSGAGEHNVGQLVRQSAGPERALLVGFTTYTGSVTASREWGGEPERRTIRRARLDSYENLFYRTHLDRFYLSLYAEPVEAVQLPMLERAIGVLYRPETEFQSHYFQARLAAQFDAIFHIDESEAIEPLD